MHCQHYFISNVYDTAYSTVCGKRLLIKVSPFNHKNHFNVIRIGDGILLHVNELLVNTQYETKYADCHGNIYIMMTVMNIHDKQSK